jgi:hypothetical protein
VHSIAQWAVDVSSVLNLGRSLISQVIVQTIWRRTMRRFLKKIKISTIGYFFLLLMLGNVVVTNILRIAGYTITYSNTDRVFVILQIFGVAIIAWILGWAAAHKDDE